MNRLVIFIAVVGLLLGTSSAFAGTADVVFLVDESGSMGGEHAWLTNMVTDLETALAAAGVGGGGAAGDNRYAMVGFGGSDGGGTWQSGHKHAVGGGDFGSAAQLSTATSTLVTSGGFEDGWQAMDFAMDNYTFTGDAVNFILITDEDRDNNSSAPGFGLTYAGVLGDLQSNGVILNVVINGALRTSGGATALGVADDLTAYQADGSGGFTESANGSVLSAAGNTKTTYIDMAWDTNGAAWDLNQLRVGGNTATSFTAAFTDHKVEEIITSIVPLPAGAWMGLALLSGLGITRRLRRRR